MQFLKNLICGALIGISSIIPGMSGGTMAVILDIFDQMIGSISSLRHTFKKSVCYLFPIGLGMAAGVLLFSGVLSGLLASYPVPMQFFFIGVVVGSIPLVLRKEREEAFRPHSFLALIVTLAAMLCVYFIRPDDTAVQLIRTPDMVQMVQLGLYSAFAAAAMVIPGVSGSFFLMLFGVYHSILAAVSELNMSVLIPVGVGMVIGILFCAKILDILLKAHKQAVYFGILGCVIGSIPNIWPSGLSCAHILPAIVFCALGAAISFFASSEWLRNRFQRLNGKNCKK